VACWNVAQALRGRGLHLHRGGSSTSPELPLTTELFLVAHEFQLSAERSEGNVSCGGDLDIDRLRDGVNRVGMLFLAATDLLDRVLFGIALGASDSASGGSLGGGGASGGGGERLSSPATRALVDKALGWIVTAQATAAHVADAAADADLSGAVVGAATENAAAMDLDGLEGGSGGRGHNNDPGGAQGRAVLLQALGGMRVSLSVLRLMAGLQGYLGSVSSNDFGGRAKAVVTTAASEELALLGLLDECQTELALVPADKLSAAASAAKHRHHSAVAHRLLRIAINQMEAQGLGLGSNGNGSDSPEGSSWDVGAEQAAAKSTLSRLYCDLFHAAPTTDACLEVAGNILHLLNDAAQSREVGRKGCGFYCLALKLVLLFCMLHKSMCSHLFPMHRQAGSRRKALR